MYETFIAPTENSPSSLTIKRALLTYDKVVLSDPEDRDYFPPQSFMAVTSGLPFFGINTGPVRPLGKTKNYADKFDKLMDEVDYARREGLIDVISTYDTSTSNILSLGGIDQGGYPLDSSFLLHAYRNVARDNDVLLAAVRDAPLIAKCSEEQLNTLAGEIAKADGGINQDPALPLLEADLACEDSRDPITKIARARIASVIKSVGFCTAKNMVPTFSDANYAKVLGAITDRSKRVIDQVFEDDPHWNLRSRVLDIAHREYVNDDILAQMSIDDVLKLRTKKWGVQKEARDALLRSAAALAQDCKLSEDFESEIIKRISDYQSTWSDVHTERNKLSFQIKCDFAKGGLGASASVMAGDLIGSVAQLQTAYGAATGLLTGCIYGVTKIKEYKPIRDNILFAEDEFKDNACYGIHNFYNG